MDTKGKPCDSRARGCLATLKGFEPSVSAVTGQRFKPLSYRVLSLRLSAFKASLEERKACGLSFRLGSLPELWKRFGTWLIGTYRHLFCSC